MKVPPSYGDRVDVQVRDIDVPRLELPRRIVFLNRGGHSRCEAHHLGHGEEGIRLLAIGLLPCAGSGF